MRSAATAPATRVQVIARSKRRGASPVRAASALPASALDEEDSCGSTITAFELDRAACEVVLARRHVFQVEALDDHDLRSQQRLVSGIALLFGALRLDREVVDTDQLHAVIDAPARGGAIERHEVAVERLHRFAPALAVARLEEDPLGIRRHAAAFEPRGADVAGAVELDDPARPHQRVDGKLVDGRRALDEMARWIP